jgi:hypothetical protein
VIEQGWTVVASDGSELGKVDEVAGDTNADIFDGLIVKAGPLGKRRYVPAEQVSQIVEGRIELSVTPTEFERIEEYADPPSPAAILPETASPFERIAGAIRRAFGRS